ncbi:MAG: type I restriction endonuclease [Marinilabiliaceae bacterium]|nr:type I restriction endonuclease [Marinilabiliaceae bacterium]
MDFKDLIYQIAESIEKHKDKMPTEAATKMALVIPFIKALGYDVYNPSEVLPEMTCDIGMKKGEKVDYAILLNGVPIILIECKHWAINLTLHDNQLIRYFNVSKAKFGVLTNGIIYRFYTDLEEPNIMDKKPFLEINLLDIKDYQIEELKKFHKSYFDIDTILNSASELKYTSELKKLIEKEFNNPQPEFVKYFAKQIYKNSIWSHILDMFTELTKKSLQDYINDRITERIKSALENKKPKEEQPIVKNLPEGVVDISECGTIITTQEHIDGFNIVRRILEKEVDASRIIYTNYKTVFVVSIDKSWKWICRFYFKKYKYIAFPIDGKEKRFEIKTLDDISNFSDKLFAAMNRKQIQ